MAIDDQIIDPVCLARFPIDGHDFGGELAGETNAGFVMVWQNHFAFAVAPTDRTI